MGKNSKGFRIGKYETKKTWLRNLNDIAENYDKVIIRGWEFLYSEKIQRLFQLFVPYISGKTAIEIGTGDGEMSKYIIEHFEKVVFVDGSQLVLKELRKKFKTIKNKSLIYVESLVEDLEFNEKFDAIFFTHILEHLNQPIKVLKKIKNLLKPEGKLFVAVPNANSLHRHIGVKLGMLESITSLNEQDIFLDHKRVYTPKLFKTHISRAGYQIIAFGGLMVKPLSNRQMEKFDKKLIDAFFEISNLMPEFCSEIYCIAKLKEKK